MVDEAMRPVTSPIEVATTRERTASVAAGRRLLAHGALPLALATVLALAVFAPLLGPGVVLLLDYGDYPAGPNPSLPGSVWGFPPGLTSRAPVNAMLDMTNPSSPGAATQTRFPFSKNSRACMACEAA